MSEILPCPATLKPCQTYLKLAIDHEKLNPTLTYWSRVYALQMGMKIDSKSKENRDFLMSLMDWLEKEKKSKETDEKFTNEVVAQAHVENYGMKIFARADSDDRAGNATKNTAKQFFTASQIFDMSAVFGEVAEDISQKCKYSKWRAAYIIKCIKSGEKPLPPEEERTENVDQASGNENNDLNIGNPPAPQTFNNDDLNLNQINNLKIDNKPPVSASSIASNPTVNYEDTSSNASSSLTALNGAKIGVDQVLKAQKLCKWASSALDYEDIKTAAQNLEKALNLLQRGFE